MASLLSLSAFRKKISGSITKEEMKKLQIAGAKPRSPLRHSNYKTWVCTRCHHVSYYKVGRCLTCEGLDIREINNPANYQVPAIMAGP
jgi:hypothetical protein